MTNKNDIETLLTYDLAYYDPVEGMHMPVPDDCKDFIKDTLEHYKASQWQPIETAPRDGTKVFVRGYVPETRTEYFETCMYDDYLNRFMCIHGKREIGSAFLTHWQEITPPKGNDDD